MNSVPKLFSCSYADCWTEKHFSTEFGVLTSNHTHSHTLFWGCVSRWFGRALAWHARGQRFDPAILHQKSTILRRKHGAFLFAEADFLGLHCFACTVFRLLQAVPIQPPTFDFTPIFKKECLPPGFSAGCRIIPFNVRCREQKMPTAICRLQKHWHFLRNNYLECMSNVYSNSYIFSQLIFRFR